MQKEFNIPTFGQLTHHLEMEANKPEMILYFKKKKDPEE